MSEQDNTIAENQNTDNNLGEDFFPQSVKIGIFMICALEMLFLLVFAFMVIFDVISEEAFLGATLSMALSNVVAIIGVAVAVWAGLSIANMVQKREVESIKRNAVKALNDASKAKKDAEAVKTDLNEKKVTDEQSSKIEFLIELEQLSVDELSKWLFQEFQKRDDSPKPFSWADLVTIEREFRLVDLAWREKRLRKNASVISIANSVISRINAQKDKFEKAFFKAYATVRLADLYYYQGKMKRDNECFNNAIKLYNDPILFTAFFDSSNSKSLLEYCKECQLSVDADRRNIAAYFCNTVGDAYIGVQQYDMAKTYCENAVALCKKGINSLETYERNLGCAIEGTKKRQLKSISDFDEIMGHYNNSADVKMTEDNIKTRVSLIDKHINAWLELPYEVNVDKDNALSHFTNKSIDSVIEAVRGFDQDTLNHLIRINNEMCRLAALCSIRFPQNETGEIYGSISDRNDYVFEKALGGDAIEPVKQSMQGLQDEFRKAPGFVRLITNDLIEIIKYEDSHSGES